MAQLLETVCKQCERTFTYELKLGKVRTFCPDPDCIRIRKRDEGRRRRTNGRDGAKCQSPWCNKLAIKADYTLCESCARRKRLGLEGPPNMPQYRWGTEYFTVKLPSHPLANKRGEVLEHRVIVYSKYGESLPDCYWCGTGINWKTCNVDHLDDNKKNNHPDNLVPSCHKCNATRGVLARFLTEIRPDKVEEMLARAGYKHPSIHFPVSINTDVEFVQDSQQTAA
jgi:hypothetical protein